MRKTILVTFQSWDFNLLLLLPLQEPFDADEYIERLAWRTPGGGSKGGAEAFDPKRYVCHPHLLHITLRVDRQVTNVSPGIYNFAASGTLKNLRYEVVYIGLAFTEISCLPITLTLMTTMLLKSIFIIRSIYAQYLSTYHVMLSFFKLQIWFQDFNAVVL